MKKFYQNRLFEGRRGVISKMKNLDDDFGRGKKSIGEKTEIDEDIGEDWEMYRTGGKKIVPFGNKKNILSVGRDYERMKKGKKEVFPMGYEKVDIDWEGMEGEDEEDYEDYMNSLLQEIESYSEDVPVVSPEISDDYALEDYNLSDISDSLANINEKLSELVSLIRDSFEEESYGTGEEEEKEEEKSKPSRSFGSGSSPKEEEEETGEEGSEETEEDEDEVINVRKGEIEKPEEGSEEETGEEVESEEESEEEESEEEEKKESINREKGKEIKEEKEDGEEDSESEEDEEESEEEKEENNREEVDDEEEVISDEIPNEVKKLLSPIEEEEDIDPKDTEKIVKAVNLRKDRIEKILDFLYSGKKSEEQYDLFDIQELSTALKEISDILNYRLHNKNGTITEEIDSENTEDDIYKDERAEIERLLAPLDEDDTELGAETKTEEFKNAVKRGVSVRRERIIEILNYLYGEDKFDISKVGASDVSTLSKILQMLNDVLNLRIGTSSGESNVYDKEQKILQDKENLKTEKNEYEFYTNYISEISEKLLSAIPKLTEKLEETKMDDSLRAEILKYKSILEHYSGQLSDSATPEDIKRFVATEAEKMLDYMFV